MRAGAKCDGRTVAKPESVEGTLDGRDVAPVVIPTAEQLLWCLVGGRRSNAPELLEVGLLVEHDNLVAAADQNRAVPDGFVPGLAKEVILQAVSEQDNVATVVPAVALSGRQHGVPKERRRITADPSV